MAKLKKDLALEKRPGKGYDKAWKRMSFLKKLSKWGRNGAALPMMR